MPIFCGEGKREQARQGINLAGLRGSAKGATGMATQKGGKRIKVSVFLDAETHAKLAGASALAGMDRSAYAAAAIRDAVSSIVLFDRRANQRKTAGRADPDGRAVQEIESADTALDLDGSGEIAA